MPMRQTPNDEGVYIQHYEKAIFNVENKRKVGSPRLLLKRIFTLHVVMKN